MHRVCVTVRHSNEHVVAYCDSVCESSIILSWSSELSVSVLLDAV